MVATLAPHHGNIAGSGSSKDPTQPVLSISSGSGSSRSASVAMRRRRSKGTIAGYGAGEYESSSSHAHDAPEKPTLSHMNMNMNKNMNMSIPPAPTASSENSLDGSVHKLPQHHLGDSSLSVASMAKQKPNAHHAVPAKPCHNAKLALLCAQNAFHMGARTQLNLCPPGKARDDLMKSLLDKRRRKKKFPAAAVPPPTMRRSLSFSRNPSIGSVGSRMSMDETSAFEKLMGENGLADYDHAEEEYLKNPGMYSRDVNSDGEEFHEDPSSGDEDGLDVAFDDDDSYATRRDRGAEKDNGHDPVKEPLFTLGMDGSAANNQGATSSGKLAFNFRKLKWFDAVTASDRATARQYLRQELRNLKKKDVMALTSHLKKLQRREKRRMEIEKGRRNGLNSALSDITFSDYENDDDNGTSVAGMSKLPSNMTPSLSAALILESLEINPLESLEGMSKCYEGIVAAGSALLDLKLDDSSRTNKPTKKEILAALTPLLITTVQQESGEAILALAKLRKLCGTKRYQRRFIQRIAPSLVRPPDAAMWCLRHQNEMEAIFSATELIFDASHEIFSADWYERGRTLLADSKRAESLNAAAMKLQRLSSPQPAESFISSLTSSNHRRSVSLSIHTPTKDSSGPTTGVNKEDLAEWEILAVDRQIRDSIKNLFSRDWSRIVIKNAPPREGESLHPTKKPRGISAGKSKQPVPPPPLETDVNAHDGKTDESLVSPPRLTNSKHMLRNATGSSHQTPTSSPNRSKRSGRRSGERDESPANSNNMSKGSKVAVPSQMDESPPHTPKSTQIEFIPTSPPSSPMVENGSPVTFKKSINTGAPSPPVMSPPGPAPLSPSKKAFRRNESNRLSNNSPGSSASAQSTYLRTLTSTAAERKRTVAACRALRAQITRFEDAFIKVHGRPPKGANDRAPLATTYAQYREWKRAIRADAASRIQAMYRGARVRMILVRDPRFKRIVERRKGRVQTSSLPQMPSGIGNIAKDAQPIPPMPRREDPGGMAYDGVEVVMIPQNQAASAWARGPSDIDSLAYSRTSRSTASTTSTPFSPRTDSTISSSNTSSDISHLTLAELQTKKRELKQLLKKYDMEFFKAQGRMPVKAEKEPIRDLYEKYNELKTRIVAVERNPNLVEAPPPIQSPRGGWKQVPTNSNTSIHSIQSEFGHSIGSDSNSHPSIPSIAPRVPNRSRRPSSPQQQPSNGNRPADLSALKTEKQHLHQMLRAYEKDFFRMHSRQVSSYADIRPVASQYRRYKEIKKSILALQQASGET